VEQVKERTFTIKNKLGLHARAANMVVQAASNFACTITINKDGIEANAKSIMGLLLLAAGHGSEVVVRAEGKDASKAVEEIGRLIEDKFGEKEHATYQRRKGL
jgi:phosphocarrier protein HPr